MGTLVSITTVHDTPETAAMVERALDWFAAVEACCSRFEPESELRRLCGSVNRDVPLSPMLFEALHTALGVARASGGAFDPTLGAKMEAAGYDRNDRTGVRAASGVGLQAEASFRDVRLDARRRSARLRRPLLLDLGSVAKGLAVDLAARELAPLGDGAGGFAIDAGGDLYLAGRNPAGLAWQVGLRHPRQPEAIFETVAVSGAALCTSGDYERGRHVLDGRHHVPAMLACSASVIAPNAMAADALATAAFVLGPRDGLALLQREAVAGLILSPQLERFTTPDWPSGKGPA